MNGEAIGTVARVVAVLRTVAVARRPVSVSEIAGELDLPVSTTHRLVQLLRHEGVIEQVPVRSRYRPGPEFLRMARALPAQDDVVSRARTVLRRIVEECDETAQFARYLPSEQQMAFVAQADCNHPLRFAIPLDKPQSLVWGSSGRAILAHLPTDMVAEILAAERPSPTDGRSAPTAFELEPTLERIRTEGWDITYGEKLANSVGFSGPVFSGGVVVGSISIPIPTVRYDEKHRAYFRDLIVQACTELSDPLPKEP